MPYRIRKCTGVKLYKVYGKEGNPLSGFCMPLKRAKKQKIAVTLADLRQEGRIPARKK